jgi:hypothetical protein
VSPILALARCMSRLPPERHAQIQRAYATARATGMGDAEASRVVLSLLTDAERAEPDVHDATVGRPTLARAGTHKTNGRPRGATGGTKTSA